jgi:hypothetical protein
VLHEEEQNQGSCQGDGDLHVGFHYRCTLVHIPEVGTPLRGAEDSIESQRIVTGAGESMIPLGS